ncbi:MAG: hypothetical protein AB1714_14175 [Acidobacteriota bacterium]
MYTVRSPAAAGRLVVDEKLGLKYFGKGTRPDMVIGSLFEAPSETKDPLEWIARVTSHIPEARTLQTVASYYVGGIPLAVARKRVPIPSWIQC